MSMRVGKFIHEKVELPKLKDEPFNKNISDLYTTYEASGINLANKQSFEQIWTNEAAWKSYTGRLLKDVTNESTKQALVTILDNDRKMLVETEDGMWGAPDAVEMESSVAGNVHLSAFLNGPVVRGVWAKTWVPLLLRVIPLKDPKYAMTIDTPYLEKDGERYYLPNALTDKALNKDLFGLKRLVPTPDGTKYLPEGWIAFTNGRVKGNLIADSLPAIEHVGLKKRIDIKISITDINHRKISGLDANGEEILDMVSPIVSRKESIRAGQNSIGKAAEYVLSKKLKIARTDSGFVEVTFTFQINLETGAFTAFTSSDAVTAFKVDAKLSSEDNRYAAVMGTEQTTFQVNVGVGAHLHLNTPVELIQDFQRSHKGADYIVAMTDTISETYAMMQNREARYFLDASYDKTTPDFIPDTVLRQANVAAAFTMKTGVAGDPLTWLEKMLKKCISFNMQIVKTTTRIEDGFWSVVGHANNIGLLPDFTYQSYDALDVNEEAGTATNLGFRVGYVFGFTTNIAGTGKIRCLYSPEFDMDDGLIQWFNSTDTSRPTYIYHPYSYTVTRGGYQNPNNVNVPSIMVTKRHTFEDILPAQIRLTIIGNDATQFNTPSVLG